MSQGTPERNREVAAQREVARIALAGVDGSLWPALVRSASMA
jgi:hypothetical protein